MEKAQMITIAGHKLPQAYYMSNDVVGLARDLIGKHLVTNINGSITAGIITETEAYAGVSDRASHAYGGRRTRRTEIMFWQGGKAYVYLCYGIHSLFNVVSNREGVPDAILIRSVYCTGGLEEAAGRLGIADHFDPEIRGPGRLARALGIHHSMTGTDLTGDDIWLEDRGMIIPPESVMITPRIGVGYAGEDASLPYRFLLKGLLWQASG
jgi:DNA-3-methyladenine glycosylase